MPVPGDVVGRHRQSQRCPPVEGLGVSRPPGGLEILGSDQLEGGDLIVTERRDGDDDAPTRSTPAGSSVVREREGGGTGVVSA